MPEVAEEKPGGNKDFDGGPDTPLEPEVCFKITKSSHCRL